MGLIKNLCLKLSYTKAIDRSSGRLETIFFENYYRIAYMAGMSTADDNIGYLVYSNTVKLMIVLLVFGVVWYGFMETTSFDEFAGNLNVSLLQFITFYRYRNMLAHEKFYKELASSMESPYFDISTEQRKKLVEFWSRTNVKYLKLLMGLGNCTLVACHAMNLRDTLSGPLLGQLAASGVLICFIGYQATATIGQSVVACMTSFLFLAYNLFDFYMICRWCQEITNQSANVGEAIYCSGWECGVSKLPGVRSTIMFVIARANKPLVLTAGGMYDLSLTSYTSRDTPSVYNCMATVSTAQCLSTSDDYVLYTMYSSFIRIISALVVWFEIWSVLGNTDVSLDQIISSVNVIFIHLVTFWKLVTVVKNKRIFKKLAKALESSNFDMSTERRKGIVNDWILINNKYLKVVLTLGCLTLIVWESYPMIDELKFNLMVDVKLPFEYQSLLTYMVTYTAVAIMFAYASLMVIISELMMQAHLIRLICQFDVLADCFENIFEECAEEFPDLKKHELVKDKTFVDKYVKRLGDLVAQHREILDW
ncbi:unnamed protein product [Spodoptera littoralis]|uniref:Odorant receptor n=1 Tax=Spodoptera littoralis TaxID=7109 RepID=A0A9P0IHU9_SPOLI|nr:unnamed protein product [Spodoptera littoralis]CAH1647016.1 unnamed protein product [Spodoptera littoralis]